MNKLHIKKDDTVVVISGDSKGTQGKVIATSPEEGKVIVAGANIVSKHTKARRQGETSSIVKTEGAIYACKVQLVCPECKKGVRVKYETVVVDGKKTKKRLCAKCGAEIK
jgi:large subunit ribosomal protein L24